MDSVKMTPKVALGHNVYLTLAVCMSLLFQFLGWFVESVILVAQNKNPLMLALASSDKNATTR